MCFTLILICLANFGSSMCWWQSFKQRGWQNFSKPTHPHLCCFTPFSLRIRRSHSLRFTHLVIRPSRCCSFHLRYTCGQTPRRFFPTAVSDVSHPQPCDVFHLDTSGFSSFVVCFLPEYQDFVRWVFEIHQMKYLVGIPNGVSKTDAIISSK